MNVQIIQILQSQNQIQKQTEFICENQQKMKPNEPEQIKNDNYEADSNQKNSNKMKGSITLSNTQMLELIEDQQKFVEQVIHYNKMGIQNLLAQDFQIALLYLQEGQKILEYAANCGKTIDRFLIISTLHNEATVYQKMLQLKQSFDYMQAILHNLQQYFQQNRSINITEEILNKQSSYYKLVSLFLHRKIKTVLYHLQFAAMSSQIDKHQQAIYSAKKALRILSTVIQKYIAYNKLVKSQQVKQSDFKNLNRYCMGIDRGHVCNLPKTVRQSVLTLRSNHGEDRNQLKLKKFSIGQVMQMQPLSFKQSNQYLPIQNLVMSYPFTRVALYASICYYTIATQMRLIAKKDRFQAEISQKFKKSKIFHLYSIKIALQFAPFFSDYHQHIIKSYKNNYHVDMNLQLPDNFEDEKISQSLLDNESFVAKKQKQLLASSQQLGKILKTQNNQNKNVRPRRISSQSAPRTDKQKTTTDGFHLNIKVKKKKKIKSPQYNGGVTQSRETFNKDKQKQDIRKSIPLKFEKKIVPSNNSRTKLGKPKTFSDRQKQKTKRQISSQKTKDQTKKIENPTNKQRNKKRIMEQYMAFPDSSSKKLLFNKKNGKKVHNQYSKSKSKSKSKSSKRQVINSKLNTVQTHQKLNIHHHHQFNNYNLGMRSPKHK